MVSSLWGGYEGEAPCKKPRILKQSILGFFENDKERTIQSDDDALLATLWIVGFEEKLGYFRLECI